MSSSVEPLLYGIALGTPSILSVGPNNLMLMREGLGRGRIVLVATSVWLSYLILLVAAFFLAGSFVPETTLLWLCLSVLSVTALSVFAVLSLRAAFRNDALHIRTTIGHETPGSCLRRVFAVVWLNPLSYIELLLIPSAVCNTFEHTDARLHFFTGLVVVETLTCYGYSFGAGLCAPLFKHPRSLQVFDLVSGLVLIALALATAAGIAGQTH